MEALGCCFACYEFVALNVLVDIFWRYLVALKWLCWLFSVFWVCKIVLFFWFWLWCFCFFFVLVSGFGFWFWFCGFGFWVCKFVLQLEVY